ncbi:hypothetical protein [Stagnihabitans tardus]|uniref:Uncharacterized protein n=1 Tax=Stagnihabitans tardus TaxID=2699202 RepID=A0AAE4Y9R7_9RHOB|nr:hypothetical protein [Stagnihabitans tardus]NBZ87924.1 hypothetical protein [Stagnihabitans tardus]
MKPKALYADLAALACHCGGGDPVEVWDMMGNAFWCQCATCGNTVHGDTPDDARASWNMEARAMLARGVAA